ncbi:MAG: hypothetical protein ABIN08_18420 [Caldimonas sp.]
MKIYSKLLVAAFLLMSMSVSASVVTLKYDCDNCDPQQLQPLPTTIFFDETTQLFERFDVRWNDIDFDFTFPNAQPAFVRQWFWDALNGLPVTPTASPDSGSEQVVPINWFADAYTPDSASCFVFFIGGSGAGPRCVLPPFSDHSIFPANVSGTATSVPISEPATTALVAIALAFAGLARSRKSFAASVGAKVA